MRWTPGYKTTEHWLTWAVLLLGLIALLRGSAAIDRAAGTIAPAIASAAYVHGRSRVKANRTRAKLPRPQCPPGPQCPPCAASRPPTCPSLASQLAELFRGRPGG